MRGEVVDQRLGVLNQSCNVDGVRRGLVFVGKASRRAAKQRDRPLDVAALNVGDADRELGKGLPECPLLDRAVLPRRLEHLVRVECQAPIQQVLRIVKGFGRRQLEIIRDTRNALAARRKWPTEGVSRTAASGPPGVVAITLDHVPMIAGLSLARSS